MELFFKFVSHWEISYKADSLIILLFLICCPIIVRMLWKKSLSVTVAISSFICILFLFFDALIIKANGLDMIGNGYNRHEFIGISGGCFDLCGVENYVLIGALTLILILALLASAFGHVLAAKRINKPDKH